MSPTVEEYADQGDGVTQEPPETPADEPVAHGPADAAGPPPPKGPEIRTAT
ncbi:hypothetical protein ACIOD0_11270 [Kitasatospora albolonga]